MKTWRYRKRWEPLTTLGACMKVLLEPAVYGLKFFLAWTRQHLDVRLAGFQHSMTSSCDLKSSRNTTSRTLLHYPCTCMNEGYLSPITYKVAGVKPLDPTNFEFPVVRWSWIKDNLLMFLKIFNRDYHTWNNMRTKRGSITRLCISLFVCGSSSGYNRLMDPPPRFCA